MYLEEAYLIHLECPLSSGRRDWRLNYLLKFTKKLMIFFLTISGGDIHRPFLLWPTIMAFFSLTWLITLVNCSISADDNRAIYWPQFVMTLPFYWTINYLQRDWDEILRVEFKYQLELLNVTAINSMVRSSTIFVVKLKNLGRQFEIF